MHRIFLYTLLIIKGYVMRARNARYIRTIVLHISSVQFRIYYMRRTTSKHFYGLYRTYIVHTQYIHPTSIHVFSKNIRLPVFLCAATKEEDLWNADDDDSDISIETLEARKQADSKAPLKKVTPEEFLGPHAKLVDFNELVSKPAPASQFTDYIFVSFKMR